MSKKKPLPEHGTLSRYINYSCRCEPCRAANSAYTRSWRKKAKRRAQREDRKA